MQTAKYFGATTLEMNLEPSAVESNFDQHIYGEASQTVPEYISLLNPAITGTPLQSGHS